ncbi:helix-turn-helix transcriptional regulator [Streptomyces sp. WMMC500]|uniref:helix-turn-helix transcriptional regulator n=1 Tax=Streptomyces sp. WMMC500 TaxID=3015154 RepID=UPI00248BDD23|nr:LuxR family transcriptional regulator [Streptomyces sp. WMMC500]WBB64407.1 helix-turn-helix transcriptional regulator [Streptomyces sp. WMMC500]
MLGAIGLDDVQESAYRALVALGAADVPELARRLTLPEPEAVRTLRRLEQQGLAAQSSARPGRWVAAPPTVALGALLIQQRHELERAELAAALLAEEYRAEAGEPADVHDLVEVVTGAGAVAHRFLQLQLGAEREVCALVTREPLAVRSQDNTAEEKAAGRGVRFRVVLERARLLAPGTVAEAAEALRRNEELRVADVVPTKLVIADGATAMVPMFAGAGEPAALVVHASGLLESLTGLFESLWRQSLPLRLNAGGTAVAEQAPDGPDAVDLQILGLLLAGLTDASAAKQLDLGLRTVQRRVKRLMEIAGVHTRLQLGWYAHERGWCGQRAPQSH